MFEECIAINGAEECSFGKTGSGLSGLRTRSLPAETFCWENERP